MNKKQVLKLIAFILIFAFIFSAVSDILRPKWLTGNMETVSAEEFYSLPKNSIEMLFLGSSQIVDGINLGQAYIDYGVSGYALAGSNFPPLINYYWLKQAYKTQKSIKLVVLDTSMLYESIEDNTRYRKSLDSMHFSIEKVQAILARCKTEGIDAIPTYLFNIIKYHSRWNELEKNDFVSDFDAYRMYNGTHLRGEIWKPDLTYEEFITDNDVPGEVDKEHEPNEVQIEYTKKIIEFCRSKGIEIVLIKTPKESWTATASQGVREIAEEYSVDFLDFTTDEMLKKMNFDFYNDMKDEDHLNVRGATKFTDYLMSVFTKKYDLTDYREVEGYEFAKLDLYKDDYEDKVMKTSVDVNEFLELINNSRFDLVITSTGDISQSWGDEQQKLLEKLGIDVNISELAGKNYVFLIHGGKCVDKEISDEPIVFSGKFSGDRKIKVTADIKASVSEAKALFGSTEKKANALGMNIYVLNVSRNAHSVTMTIKAEGNHLILKKAV